MRSIALIGVLAGLTGALVYLAADSGAPASAILIGLGPFPFYVAALGWGNLSGLIGAGTSLFIVALLTAAIPGVGIDIGIARGLAFTVTAVAPALWFSRLALLRRQVDPGNPKSDIEWYPPGRLLMWLTGIAGAGYLLAELICALTVHRSLAGFFADVFTQHLPPEARDDIVAQTKAPSWEVFVGLLSHMLPAFGGIAWQIWIVANGIGAYSLLAATGRCPRPALFWRSLSLPKSYAVPFFLCVGIALVSANLRYGALTLAAIHFVPYFLLGLSVVHAIPLKGPARMALLGLFYFLLLLQAWPAFLVGVLGLVEQWSGLRQRMAPGGREDK